MSRRAASRMSPSYPRKPSVTKLDEYGRPLYRYAWAGGFTLIMQEWASGPRGQQRSCAARIEPGRGQSGIDNSVLQATSTVTILKEVILRFHPDGTSEERPALLAYLRKL